MADAGTPWSVWSSLVEAGSIAVSALAGGVAAVVGMVWRGGHDTAIKAAREQRHVDEIAGLSTSVARIDTLAQRVSALEGQHLMIASRIEAIVTALGGMRTEMAAGFAHVSDRQDRMIETIGRGPG